MWICNDYCNFQCFREKIDVITDSKYPVHVLKIMDKIDENRCGFQTSGPGKYHAAKTKAVSQCF